MNRLQIQQASQRRYLHIARSLGCTAGQLSNFRGARYLPQAKQLEFHAAARLCDNENGPDQIGFGGARGPGKSHASFAQVALDDCRRVDGLKALYLRKIGKQAREQLKDLRRTVLGNVRHDYDKQLGELTLWNDSRIVVGNMMHESDVEKYLGIEYDVILIEEATTLTESKYRALRDSNRTSRRDWKPRIYTTTNPGGVGHSWYKRRFVDPFNAGNESFTRFVPATVDDNKMIDAGYERRLNENVGWRLQAYRYGNWDVLAGQYFNTFNSAIHVVDGLPAGAVPVHWWVAMDYGYKHPTVFLLFCKTEDGVVYCIDERSERLLSPAAHSANVYSMIAAWGLSRDVAATVYAGADVFSKTGEQNTIAEQYLAEGIGLIRADNDRVQGAGRLLSLLGDPSRGVQPKLYIGKGCSRVLESLPIMEHNPRRPEDVLKWDADADTGDGGDDGYDALRYGIMSLHSGVTSEVIAEAEDVIDRYDSGGF